MFDPTNDALVGNPKLGIYTDFYGMNYWQSSFGFIAVIGASVVFFIGLVLSIIFDIRPQKRIKHKLLVDFRNIDRYGLKDDNDEAHDEITLKTKPGVHGKHGGKTGIHPGEELKDGEMF